MLNIVNQHYTGPIIFEEVNMSSEKGLRLARIPYSNSCVMIVEQAMNFSSHFSIVSFHIKEEDEKWGIVSCLL